MVGSEKEDMDQPKASTGPSLLTQKEVLGPLTLALANVLSVLWVMPLDLQSSMISETRFGLFVCQVFICVGWLLFGPARCLIRIVTVAFLLLSMSYVAWHRTGEVKDFGVYPTASFLALAFLSSSFNLALAPSLLSTKKFGAQEDAQVSLRFRIRDVFVLTACIAVVLAFIERNALQFMAFFLAVVFAGAPLVYAPTMILRARTIGLWSVGKIMIVVPAAIAPLAVLSCFTQPLSDTLDGLSKAMVIVTSATFFIAISAAVVRWSGYRLQ